MKVAVNFKVDLSKIDRSRAYKSQNGAEYIDLTCFISPEEPDQYGQHGGIQQSTTSEERDAGIKMPYVGNVKAFWSEGVTIVKEAPPQKSPAKEISDQLFSPEPAVKAKPAPEPTFDDIPF